MMTKTLAAALVASLTFATVSAAPAQAAGNRGNGAALAIGLIGGAILGSAIAQSQTQYRAPRQVVYGYDAPRYVERQVVERYDYVPSCKRITIENDYGNATVKESCR